MRFEDLRLTQPLLDAVHTAGYTTPTPIQTEAIPHVLAGKDVLGCAQTGTGKTAAFALPILQRLAEMLPREKSRQGRIRVLVLSPTRELAQQICDSFRTYGRNTSLTQAVVFGGVNKGPQARTLRAGVDILVATPGRLLDHMGDGIVNLAGIEVLVLDEADRMLDMGFLPDVRRILAKLPRRRQTLLFSATMPDAIRTLAKDILHEPVPVQVSPASAAADGVAHFVYHVEKPEKPTLLTTLLEHTAYSRALVFSRTKHGADKVVRQLVRSGVRAAAIHGNKSQNARTRALAEFRSGKTPVLVATDIAARGLDVDDISHVINYDLTTEPETYVHRIGRTARAGASGTAMSFVTADEHDALRAIERLIRTPLQRAGDLPGYTAPKVAPRPVVLPDSAPAARRPVSIGRGQPVAGAGSRNRRRRRGAGTWRSTATTRS